MMHKPEQLTKQAVISKRKTLDEYEGNQLLAQHQIPMAKTVLCQSLDQALAAAGAMGFPVVMKILSPDILHKTEAGCVKVGIKNSEELKQAYQAIMHNALQYKPDAHIRGVIIQEMLEPGLELIFGLKRDPQFGHVILFGTGGIFVETIRDVSLRLVPINITDAYEMIDETMISPVFSGARGKRYNKDTAVSVLMALSQLAVEYPGIEEIDINPFIMYDDGNQSKGVDAVVVLNCGS
jgi:succinyl-CoA synthetase beta subunit